MEVLEVLLQIPLVCPDGLSVHSGSYAAFLPSKCPCQGLQIVKNKGATRKNQSFTET